ncbi:lysylphosphatidylglycerol synthase domain-containing protein [Methylibium sp.]|uniref:lysylphosphatidylglycerol synthase domain-containing protein n=1 Tax=Methylibium sp. TaxID=2067992 RepID=UPI0025FD2712|nr:lysylphosphatidylglycerol synthase domain-containing protein [Methylibium sp.]
MLTVLFFAAVAWLIYRNARNVDWREVGAVLLDYPNGTLWLAAAVAAASHAIYGTFDLLGRHWTGHGLAVRQVVPVTFVSYAFNLNLGSLVGGIAFRYRLYSRLGLDTDTTSRVLGLSLVTNWLGYLVLAGGVFALRVITPPDDWKFGATALQVLGFALLAAAAGYLALCAARAGHEYSVRGHRLVVPSLRMALLQLALSMANWAVIAGVIYVLLQFKLPYPLVLGVLLIAAVAGVVAHIPAGLGVLEAVFIALLGHRVPQGELLAALIAYRAIYYLAPMLAATALYLTLEARAKKGGSPAAPALHGKAA